MTAITSAFIVPIGWISYKIAGLVCKGLLVGDLNVDENLGNYF